MKRLTYALLIAALSTTMIWQVASAQTERAISDREKWCRYGSLDGQPGHWTADEVKKTIRCAARRWPVDLAKVMYIAERESGFNARAVNQQGSSACGVFQHIGWAPRVIKFNQQVPHGNAGPSCYNGRSNVMVSVRMMSNSGYGPWGG